MDKYRDVLAGIEGVEVNISNYRIHLDDASSDLETCRKCRATDVNMLKSDHYYVSDCPLGTGGYYYALSDSGTREAGKPVFAYHNCGGPAMRLQEIANLLGRRKEGA